MKRFIAVIGMVIGITIISNGINYFNGATDFIAIIKGLFWIIVGSATFASFVDDFREKRWPFGAEEQ